MGIFSRQPLDSEAPTPADGRPGDGDDRVRLLAEQCAQLERRLEEQQRAAAEEREALAAHYEEMLDAARAQIAELDRQVSWMESSRVVRVVKLARASRAVLDHHGASALARHVADWLMGKRGYYLRDLVPPADVGVPASIEAIEAIEAIEGSVPDTAGGAVGAVGAVLFLSGCPGGAMRYRAVHHAEQLQLVGYRCEVIQYGTTPLTSLPERFDAFVLHRVPYERDVERLIEQAHQHGKPVIFDTDDLVFDPDAAPHIAALPDMNPPERNLFLHQLGQYQKTLRACDACIVSTQTLRDEAERFCPQVFVAPNAVSLEMLRGADSALAVRRATRRSDENENGTVVIGYFSGTPTHNRDFDQAADAVLWALETHPQVKFKVVGHLQLDARFDRFADRIERMTFQPWQHLPHLYAGVDINLAPLEPHNPFTDAKSCLKYMEAALLGVPTIASPRMDFVRVIHHGENGLLAETPQEWREALGELIESGERRRAMGQRAYEQVRAECTSTARAPQLAETLRRIMEDASHTARADNWAGNRPRLDVIGRHG